ncbi:MAG: bleomycin resistance protein [Hyphomicrobium sp.]
MSEQSKPYDRAAVAIPLAIPILISTNMTRSAATYAAAGFNVIRPSPDYAILRRDGVELHISHVQLIPEPHCVAAYLRVADLEPWHRAFQQAQFSKILPPKDKPWGMREIHTIDSDGNLLNVGQPLQAPGVT